MAERTIDAATRIVAGDDKTRYDGVAITLHWLTALLVLSQFATSQIWDYFPKPQKHLIIVAHMSVGILLSAVIIVRIVWRLLPGRQRPAALSGWVELASKGVHYVLYVLLASEAVLGFALRWSGNEAMSFFGLQIPAPFPPTSKPVHHLIGDLHEYIGWTIVILAFGHALAALYHHYVLRDRVLLRMMPGSGV